MMYVRYDKSSGKITSFGYMDEKFVTEDVYKGEPIIPVSHEVYGDDWSVNLDTKELQNVPPLELKE
jgi:hypothetical protein